MESGFRLVLSPTELRKTQNTDTLAKSTNHFTGDIVISPPKEIGLELRYVMVRSGILSASKRVFSTKLE